jgi:AcrR family transcriptional regulator
MKHLLINVRLSINDKLYVKDPESSELGRGILRDSIDLIDGVGFDNFTFKRLATRLNTTESSVYRYFENKHKLLLYLSSWYWSWLDMHLVLRTTNIASAEERLRLMIEVMCNPDWSDYPQESMDLNRLRQIVIAESAKAYLIHEVDHANREGLFAGYKQLCKRLSDVIKEIAEDFPYPRTLSSTIVEGILHQSYFAVHFPSITDIDSAGGGLSGYYYHMAISAIKSVHHG